jgi:hypothetical protein
VGTNTSFQCQALKRGMRFDRKLSNGPATVQKHQETVIRLLTDMGAVIAPGTPAARFADHLLTANFCPFRSPSAKMLHRPSESIQFSERLWSMIFEQVTPQVILANGKDTANRFHSTLNSMAFATLSVDSSPAGWGAITYSAACLRRGHSRIWLFGLPHLARFDIRDTATERTRTEFIRRVANALGQTEIK